MTTKELPRTFGNVCGTELTLEKCSFDPEAHELTVVIDGTRGVLTLVSDRVFNPVRLTNSQPDIFSHIEHPIRDDLGRTESVIRSTLEGVLNPHGITVSKDS